MKRVCTYECLVRCIYSWLGTESKGMGLYEEQCIALQIMTRVKTQDSVWEEPQIRVHMLIRNWIQGNGSASEQPSIGLGVMYRNRLYGWYILGKSLCMCKHKHISVVCVCIQCEIKFAHKLSTVRLLVKKQVKNIIQHMSVTFNFQDTSPSNTASCYMNKPYAPRS